MNSAAELLLLDPYDAVKRPVSGSADDRLRHLLAWALLSPSPHNTQPWSWSVADGVVELRGDFSRHLTVSDPDGRELVIGCGSALEHLLLRLGLDGDPLGIDLLPEGAESTLYARITVGAGEPYVARRDLVDAMAVRRTNRTAYHGDPMDHTLRSSLEAACAAFGVSSTWISAAQDRARLVELIMTADREQMRSAGFRRELADWMRPKNSHASDGMEADLLGQKGAAAYLAPLVVRTFDIGRMQAASDSQLTEGSPDIVVLSTGSDDTPAHLAAGRALAHLTLTATAAGYSSAYMNQPCEVEDSRGDLAQLISPAGHPQLVLRIGHAEPVHRALRIPVAGVLSD